MPNTTSVLKRFEAGGVFTINNGTTTWTVTGIKAGSLKWTPGFYAPIPYKDRGTLKTPLLGDQRAGKLEIECYYAGSQATDDIGNFILGVTSGTGLVQMYTIVVKIPNYNGAAAGEQGTFANCYLPEDGLNYESGDGLDMLKLSLVHNEVKATWATY